MGRLDGRVAMVTGAGRGIGEAIARRFAREGARVCLTDVNPDGAAATVRGLVDEGMDAFAAKVDVTSRTEVENAVGETVDRYGRLDILVNNAGITKDDLVYKMTDEDWRSVLNVHLSGAFFCARAAQKHMVERRYGRIVNISSTSALGNRGQANYSAAKAGIQGFTKTLAVELGRYGITANAVAPGFIETDMTRETAARLGVDFDDFVSERVKTIPVGRGGWPEDVAASALFFASEEAAFVSGQVLYVAGGPRDLVLYEEFVGRSSEPVPNVVRREAVYLFAEAIADPSPLYREEEAAKGSRYGRLLAPPTFPRTFDYGKVDGLELPLAGLIHGEFHISYGRPLLVGDEVLCRLTLRDSYDKPGRRGLLGLLLFERTGESPDGERVFTTNDTVVVTESVRRGIGG